MYKGKIIDIATEKNQNKISNINWKPPYLGFRHINKIYLVQEIKCFVPVKATRLKPMIWVGMEDMSSFWGVW